METAIKNELDHYLKALKWRYATKKFSSEKIEEHTFNQLLEVARLSASSYGLQPYRFVVVSNPELREKLKPVCWNQSQITDASHLLVLAHYDDFDETLIDSYIDQVALTRDMDRTALQGYSDFMKSKLLDLPQQTKSSWTSKQTYIVMGNLLSAAAMAEIDSCPMEGFDVDAVNEILGLKKEGLSAATIIPFGYRSEEDLTQNNAKVRRSEKELITIL